MSQLVIKKELKTETAKEFFQRLLHMHMSVEKNQVEKQVETLTMFTNQEICELSDIFHIADRPSDIAKLLIADGWSDFKVGYILGGKQLLTAVMMEECQE